MSFEQTFASTTLDVTVPDTSLEFPTQDFLDSWLKRIGTGSFDRKQSFFDEQLRVFLVLRIKISPPEDDRPPQTLLSFLAHLQVSFEATYISPASDTQEDAGVTNVVSPPRISSLPKVNPNPRSSLHPSILPPHTPNPTPATAEHDRKYMASEGTLLLAGIWGQNPSQDASEDFTLLWSPSEQLWVAVYSFSLTVSYIRLNMSDPLLCLTVSATLRDKPITTPSSKHPLALYFANVSAQSCLVEPEIPGSMDGNDENQPVEEELSGLEEVNLLQGLHGGPQFGVGPSAVLLPSTRLGIVSRQKLFSLPPINLPSAQPPEPSPMTALRAVHPTLRKSFRKTLGTASGFRVRMRTVFVPYILLSRRAGSRSDNGEDERDKREAGNEERTIVLCIEIENSGDSGPHIGFEVEKVDVKVGGGDAETHLIAWDEASFLDADESRIFPLRINSSSQYNLLYAVWFLHPPDELNTLPFAGNHGTLFIKSTLQRTVAIYIHGKPYEKRSQNVMTDDTPALLYPTQTFSSRWNCVLDLGVRDHQKLDIINTSDPSNPTNKHANANVLPEPASPFPLSSAKSIGFVSPDQSPATTPRSSLIAGTQRLSLLSKTPILGRPFTPVKTSCSYNDQQFSSPPSTRQSYIPPSQTLAGVAQLLHFPTTYNAPTALPGILADESELSPPLTPAYPPHSPYVPTMSQGPITAQGAGSAGPSVETRRERGSGLGLTSAVSPTTPVPNGNTLFAEQHKGTSNKIMPQKSDSGQSIVISVRLLSPRDAEGIRNVGDINERIYPLTRFSIEVFVYNQSTWTRRFELSYPNTERSKRRERMTSRYENVEAAKECVHKPGYPGILPVDNRVRIGPLLPSASQIVRMQFLAVTPGIHSIDALTLTDIETGYSINLRSVMDVVVHEFS